MIRQSCIDVRGWTSIGGAVLEVVSTTMPSALESPGRQSFRRFTP